MTHTVDLLSHYSFLKVLHHDKETAYSISKKYNTVQGHGHTGLQSQHAQLVYLDLFFNNVIFKEFILRDHQFTMNPFANL